MNTFNKALFVLCHPLALFSIGLLLLNDHVFKAYFPSALTGKLSDFAGLFFFPFLVLALVGLASDWLRIPARRVSVFAPMAAFGVTGMGFVLLKVSPDTNRMMVAVIEMVLGASLWVIPDPTDLIALIAFVPGWMLWKRVALPGNPQPGKKAYWVLGLASLATLATSSAMPMRVMRVVVFEEKVYAIIVPEWVSNYTDVDFSEIEVIASKDGQSWLAVEPAHLYEELSQELQGTPDTLNCEPEAPSNCYQISRPDQLEGSTDGGQTWQVIWKIPKGRREFMERYLKTIFVSQKSGIDDGPYDLALFSLNGNGIVVAAMGNEGILVRTPDGNWERLGVTGAWPTPYAGGQLPFIILTETAVLLLISTIGINFLTYELGLWLTEHYQLGGWLDAVAPIWWGLGAAIVGGLLYFAVFMSVFEPFTGLMLLVVMPVFIGPVWAWSRIIKISTHVKLFKQVRAAALLIALGIFPTAWFPFLAWFNGVIAVYSHALILSIALGSLCILLGVIGFIQTYRKLKLEQTPQTEST